MNRTDIQDNRGPRQKAEPVMTKTDEVIAALMPFCREAYGDGLRGECREAWEHFGEESERALYETGGEPSPAYVKFVRNFGQECRRLWEKGRKLGSGRRE